MLTKGLKQLFKPAFNNANRRFINHIKNMNEENLRVQVDEISREPAIVKTNRVYKPTYTI